YMLHPTFGYLIGFMFGAWTAGFIVEKRKTKGFKTMLIASLANVCVVYLFGLTYYYFIANYYINSPIGVGALMLNCFLVFLPSDFTFCIIASLIANRLYPVVAKGDIA
ncbi:MAG: biotin transporter BioY, partial [Oscillospiraceae bacterium]